MGAHGGRLRVPLKLFRQTHKLNFKERDRIRRVAYVDNPI
jgi:hypothetical protein